MSEKVVLTQEQAERVQELEEEVQDISVWNHGHRCHIHKLKQQNKRYREALERIAYDDELLSNTDDIIAAKEVLEGEE